MCTIMQSGIVMENCVLDDKILVIGHSDIDYLAILECLPEFTKVDHYVSLNDVDFDSFSDDYILRICNGIFGSIMDPKCLMTMEGYASIEFFGAFRRGMKRISKLYQKNQGNLIILTRMPIRYLLAYFKLLDDDLDVSALFANYYDELICNLSHGYSDFVLHKHDNVYIITKPDFEGATNRMLWKNRFKMLVEKICAPYNTDTEKNGI